MNYCDRFAEFVLETTTRIINVLIAAVATSKGLRRPLVITDQHRVVIYGLQMNVLCLAHVRSLGTKLSPLSHCSFYSHGRL